MGKPLITVLGDVLGWVIKVAVWAEVFVLLGYALHAGAINLMAADKVAGARAVTEFWVPPMKAGFILGAVLGLLGYLKGAKLKPEHEEFFGWLQYSVIACEMFMLLAVGSLHFETGVKYYDWLWIFAYTYVFGILLALYGYKRGAPERMERLYGIKPPVQEKPK